MNCHRLSSLLSAYIDGELTGVEMIEIRRHVDGCPNCEAELDHLRATKRLLGRLRTAQPSAELPNRIFASLDSVQPYSWLATWSRLWQAPFQRLSPAVAAVGVVVLGMLVFTAGNIDEKLQASHPQMAVSSPMAPSVAAVSLRMDDPPRPVVPVEKMLGTRLANEPKPGPRPTIRFVDYGLR